MHPQLNYDVSYETFLRSHQQELYCQRDWIVQSPHCAGSVRQQRSEETLPSPEEAETLPPPMCPAFSFNCANVACCNLTPQLHYSGSTKPALSILYPTNNNMLKCRRFQICLQCQTMCYDLSHCRTIISSSCLLGQLGLLVLV